jgi:flagellar hook-associated protein 1
MSIFGGIAVGGRALSAYQAAMDIIGHNIANANTEGYSRQRATLAATEPDILPYGAVGTGVEITDVRRIRDAYLDLQKYTELGTLGQWEMKDDALQQLELYFPEPSDTSLNNLLSNFWQAWSDVANSPDDQISRVNLIQQSLVLTDSINNTRSKMNLCQENVDGLIETKVDEVNSLTSQIAVLNSQILSSETSGNAANDLRDKRDLVVSKLSQIVDFSLNEQADGTYAISINGKPAVWAAQTAEIEAVPDPLNDNLVALQWKDTGESVAPANGELAGLLYARDTCIPAYMTKLDTIVGNLISAVNTVYARGYDLDGTAVAGHDWVDFFSGTDASDITVNQYVQDDPSRIAAALSADPGDNSNARAIAALMDTSIAGLSTTFSQYYQSQIIGTLGIEVQEASQTKENESLIVDQLSDNIQAVSGVSLDEEMSTMIQYQHAYEAAAKYMTMASAMLDALLGII